MEITGRLVAQNQDMPSSANTLAQSLELMAQLSAQKGEGEQSIGQFRDAIDVTKRLVSSYPDIPKYRQKLAVLHGQVAIHYRCQARFEAALEFQQQATALLEQLAQDYPANSEYQILRIQSSYRTAAVLEMLKRFDDATAHMDRAKNLILQLSPQAKSKLSYEKYGMAELLRIAARIRTAAGDMAGGIESEWHRELLQAVAP